MPNDNEADQTLFATGALLNPCDGKVIRGCDDHDRMPLFRDFRPAHSWIFAVGWLGEIAHWRIRWSDIENDGYKL